MNAELIDYYQKWASTHATIIVAVFFGLFSILTLVYQVGEKISFSLFSITHISFSPQNLSMVFLTGIYVVLVAFGAYEADRWKWYATQAGEIAKSLGAKEHGWKKRRFAWLASKAFKHVTWLFTIFGFLAFLSILLSL